MTNTLNILSDPHEMTITVASYGQIALHLGNRNLKNGAILLKNGKKWCHSMEQYINQSFMI